MATYQIGSDVTDDYASWTAMQVAVQETAGDIVSFRKGEEFREQITVPNSGTSGNVITYTAHGSGADPIINGSDLITGWTEASSWTTVYTASLVTSNNYGSGNDMNARQVLGTFSTGGTKIRVTFTATGYAAGTQITATTFGKRSGTSDDFTESPTAITFDSGNPDKFLPQNTTYLSDEIIYTTDVSTSYMIAIWHDNNTAVKYTDDAGATLYTEHGVGLSDESGDIAVSGYTTRTRYQTINKVEVLGTSATVWQATLNTDPYQVFFDGVLGNEQASLEDVDSDKDWYWAANVLYVYSTSDPDTAYTSPGIEASVRNNCVRIADKSYITVEDLHLTMANQNLVIVNYSGGAITDFNIDNLTCDYSYLHNIEVYTESGGQNINNGIIQNCTLTYAGANGIKHNANGSTWTHSNNLIHDNGQNEVQDYISGIKCDRIGLSNVIIENNEIYNTSIGKSGDRGLGIWIDTVGSGFIIRYNIIHGGRHHGIQTEAISGAQVYYNICYGNPVGIYAGIDITRDSDQVEVYNNICYGNGIGIQIRGDGSANSSTDNIVKNNIATSNAVEFSAINGGENDGTNGHGNVYEYNCFGVESSNFIQWASGVYKSTYDAWETAYGDSTHSVEADPLFIDP